MNYQNVDEDKKDEFNASVSHPLQSWQWGEFREKTGLTVIRRAVVSGNILKDAYQMTIHKIPGMKANIGYLPKGYMPTEGFLKDLREVGNSQNCAYIQIEPNVEKQEAKNAAIFNNLRSSFRPLFPKYTFVLDITKSEEELLKNLHQKTRYNVRVAQKHGVEIVEGTSPEGFEEYLRLVEETTKRQKFYAHSKDYQVKVWETLKNSNKNGLKAHLFLAKYKGKILVAWMLFVFKDTLYYPYGASSNEHRETMASNLMMWEAIKFGKNQGLSKFDMWGSLGPDAKNNDPWYGFHRFKEGYNPRLVEFVGDYDLVLKPSIYSVLKIADKARWTYLRAKKLI